MKQVVYQLNWRLVLLLTIFNLISIFKTRGESLNPAKSQDSLRFAIYVDNVYNINYDNSSYDVIFYIWYNSIGERYSLDDVDIMNALNKELLYEEIDSIVSEGVVYYSDIRKYCCTISNNLFTEKFPFDRNKLELLIELEGHISGQKKVNFDYDNSNLIPDFINNWKVEGAQVKITKNCWSSNFGDFDIHLEDDKKGKYLDIPKSDIPCYDAIKIELNIKRNSWGIYLKMFAVLFLALIIATSSIFLPNRHSEEKISIIVGSLFTTIGNKYISDSNLPLIDSWGLSDQLHFLTILSILFLTIYAIYEQRKLLKDSLKKELLLFIIINAVYFGIVAIITAVYIQ
jgi:hypothetical protein